MGLIYMLMVSLFFVISWTFHLVNTLYLCPFYHLRKKFARSEEDSICFDDKEITFCITFVWMLLIYSNWVKSPFERGFVCHRKTSYRKCKQIMRGRRWEMVLCKMLPHRNSTHWVSIWAFGEWYTASKDHTILSGQSCSPKNWICRDYSMPLMRDIARNLWKKHGHRELWSLSEEWFWSSILILEGWIWPSHSDSSENKRIPKYLTEQHWNSR